MLNKLKPQVIDKKSINRQKNNKKEKKIIMSEHI
jgi:hypothetical protein